MKQDAIDHKATRLFAHIWFLTEQFSAILSACGDRECNLSAQEIKAMEFLGRGGPCKMRSLADYLRLAVSSTTTLVDNLEAKNVVHRERSLEDRRVIMLRLTEDGMRDYEVTVEAFQQYCRNLLKTLEAADQDNLLRIFDTIKQASNVNPSKEVL
jgi:DNA-binding MarR family transcriptional regulator